MADTLSDEQYQAIVDAHPGVRLRRVMGPAGEIVLRAPTAIEESTYQSMLFGSSMHAGIAMRNLLMMLVVHPDKLGFQKMLAQWPGLNTEYDDHPCSARHSRGGERGRGKIIGRLLKRHKSSGTASARNYMALFAGDESRDAMIAAMRFDRFVELVIGFLEGWAKKR